MTERPFVHLHCHTHYSLLDGAGPIKKLVQRARDHGMNALAITDHGNLHGAIDFYRKLNRPDIRNKWTALLEPRYVLQVARLLDEMGDREGARAEYQRFLDLWKDADPELPELAEARRYLVKESL